MSASAFLKGGQKCIVKACGNSRRKNPDVIFHKFPKDKEMCKKWLEAIGSGIILSRASLYVCGSHFQESDYLNLSVSKYLNKNAVPSMNIFPSEIHLFQPLNIKSEVIIPDEVPNDITEGACPTSQSSVPEAHMKTVGSISTFQTESLKFISEPSVGNGTSGQKITTFEENNHEMITSRKDEEEKAGGEHDTEYYYCMSLMTRLRQLHPKRRRRVRLKIDNIMFEAEEEEADSIPSN